MSDLVDALKARKISIREGKKNNICLDDIVRKIIKSKEPIEYMEKIDEKFKYREKFFITEERCLRFLEERKCIEFKKILEEIKDESERDMTSIVNIADNILQYEGTRFVTFLIAKENGSYDMWIKAGDIVTILRCESKISNVIEAHVHKKNKVSYRDIEKKIDFSELAIVKKINYQPNTLFINLAGASSLTEGGSDENFAEKLKEWFDTDVLDALSNYDSRTKQPAELIIKLFCDEVLISDFYDKKVVYIGYIGKINGEHMFKYGRTMTIFKRDYEQHSKDFKTFKVVYIGETINYEQIEATFEHIVKQMHFHRKLKDYGKEFFTVSLEFTYEYFINVMRDLIEKDLLNSSNGIKEMEHRHEIEKMKLQYELNKSDPQVRLAEELTKQKKLDNDAMNINSKRTKKSKIKSNEDSETDSEENSETDSEENSETDSEENSETDSEENSESKSDSDSEEESEDENAIYKQFLSDCTKKSEKHIATKELYEAFKKWHKKNKREEKLPGQRKFIVGLRTQSYLDIRINSRVGKVVGLVSVRNLQLKKQKS